MLVSYFVPVMLFQGKVVVFLQFYKTWIGKVFFMKNSVKSIKHCLMMVALAAAGAVFANDASRMNDDEKSIALPGNVDLKMVKINPGSFMRKFSDEKMSPEIAASAKSYYLGEIVLSKPYWIGKFEVTQEQYKAVVGTNPGRPQNNALPVNNVKWNDAKAFCNELNRIYAGKLPAGYEFALPSEAQWEFAAWGAKNEFLLYGNEQNYAWFKENTRTIQICGQKQPNRRGIYDMLGNVAEYCRDTYKNYLSKYIEGRIFDPVCEEFGNGPAVRGGSFRSSREWCMPAARVESREGAVSADIGFRLALVPINKPVLDSKTFTLGNGCSFDMVRLPTGYMQYIDSKAPEVWMQHDVWMGKCEVTQELFEAVMGYNPSKIKGRKHPVESVTREEAEMFCYKLTEIFASQLEERYIFALPYASFLKYACRAGTASPYNAGYDSSAEKIDLDQYFWHQDNADGSHHEVGRKKPNRWGFYDMHGNVREMSLWSEACGGGWKDGWEKCKSGVKTKEFKKNYKSDDLGFRIILLQGYILEH